MLVALLLLIIAISVIGGLLVFAFGAGETIGGSIWWTFLHVSDPGYLGDDDTPVTAILGTIFTILGMIVFVAGLVGILTSLITSALMRLREGGAPIVFRNHIVIVGWNARVFSIVEDLLDADLDYQIALLAQLDKVDAERQLEKRVFSRIARQHGNRTAHAARGHVVYRQGSPLVDHDLSRVAAAQASRFILLASDSGDSVTATDVAQIRNLYSIEHTHEEGERCGDRFSTVVELASDELRSHAFYSLRIDPRTDAWVAYSEEQLRKRGQRSYLPVLAGEVSRNDLTAVNTAQIVSRVIVQCAVQPCLSSVYDELLSFRGRELFLWQPAAHWRDVWNNMLQLPAVQRPAFLGQHTVQGIVIGLVDDKGFSFDPAQWRALNADDHYVVLGDKQRWQSRPRTVSKPRVFDAGCALAPSSPEHGYRVLVLGMNSRFPLVVEQFTDYAEQYPQIAVSIDVVALDGQAAVPDHPGLVTITQYRGDYTQWDVLGRQLEECGDYDTILLLSEDKPIDDPEVDARVTLALVMLRAFRDDENWRAGLRNVNVVAEIRDPRNRNILRQEELAGDVIVGDEYVSGFIAQVCIDFRLEELYREILDYGHYEIYTRKLLLDDKPVTFGDLVASCAQRGETAIGFLRQHGVSQMQSTLAPDFSEPLAAGDLPLVIARD
tara:strand:+ start:8252 stop:10243 length:1992 start_codon:yes stop_codon:yes gene_type:complete